MPSASLRGSNAYPRHGVLCDRRASRFRQVSPSWISGPLQCVSPMSQQLYTISVHLLLPFAVVTLPPYPSSHAAGPRGDGSSLRRGATSESPEEAPPVEGLPSSRVGARGATGGFKHGLLTTCPGVSSNDLLLQLMFGIPRLRPKFLCSIPSSSIRHRQRSKTNHQINGPWQATIRLHAPKPHQYTYSRETRYQENIVHA